MNNNEITKQKLEKFNPNENGLHDHGIFGLPFNTEESKLVLVPVPWEATVSYGSGASRGPKAILDASQQIDLYDDLNPNAWRLGIAMQDIPTDMYYENMQVCEKTKKYLDGYLNGEKDENLLEEINNNCKSLNKRVEEITAKLLEENKIVGIVGGDHSSPFGFIKALSKKHKNFGILHIDAHADLRCAYEGFNDSHASIFHNVLSIKNISKLVQIGIRDISEEEINTIRNNKDRIILYTDYEIKKDIYKGKSWDKKCDDIIKHLPKDVYISFDIDGLCPSLCPSTGTPVPGGFKIEEVTYLIEKIVKSGRKIIGFDLCEVVPSKDGSEWDANVGARVLYKLCLLILKSQVK
jgi:agmatinase